MRRGVSMAIRPLNRHAKRELLRGSSLFSVLRLAELDQLVGIVTERRFRKGAIIIERGREGSDMLVLASGRVRVTATSASGREVTIAILEPGMTFGELSLLDGEPRSATVAAMDSCLTLAIERRDLLPLLRSNADLVLRLLGVFCGRLRQTSLALEEIALMDLPARLARLLIKLGQQYGVASENGVRIGLTVS